MKKGRIVSIFILLFSTVTAFQAGALIAGEEDVVVEGILVDTKCYAQDSRNTTNDHDTPAGTMVSCGTACAAIGIPVGVLREGKAGNDVHVLLVPSRVLADQVGKWVRVTGKYALGGSLMVDKLEVRDDSGNYKVVEIITMM